MNRITNSETLKKSVEVLRLKREQQGLLMKENFTELIESLRPSNIIKHSLEEITDPEHPGDLGKAAIGVASGIIAKKLLFRSSSNPLKKLAGVAVQALVTKIAASQSDNIKASGKNILQRIAAKLRRKEEPQESS